MTTQKISSVTHSRNFPGIILLILPVLLIFQSCINRENNNEEVSLTDIYEEYGLSPISGFFSPQEADTLLTDIITYIGKKPAVADNQSLFLPEFRKYFIDQSDKYKFVYYHIGDEDLHYFYLIRPARSVAGNARGVGGGFRLSGQKKISGFREVFNTPVQDTLQLYISGAILFSDLIKHKNINNHLGDTSLIEWPDHRMQYDTVNNEWRYIVDY